MGVRLAFVVFVALIVFSACRSGGDGDSAEKPTAAASIESTTSATLPSTSPKTTASDDACAAGRDSVSGEANGVITSGGLERTYILHVPTAYDGANAMPLVFNLHGYSSNATDQDRYSGLPALGEERGFIVVSPEGSGEIQHWDFPGFGPVDDVAFIGELLDKLERELCIDAARVYIAGMSNGAAIATFVACGLPGRIAAIAEVAATAGPRLCDSDDAIPIMTFRGTDDACVPYEGGTAACGQLLPVIAAEEVMRLWGEHNGCNAPAVTANVSEHVRTISYGHCTDEADAILYTIEGGGHTWPGAIEVARLDATTQEIDATELIWSFFEAHAR